jgi:hypothetical protein
MQVNAEQRIHEMRKVNVTLVSDDGRKEIIQLTESQFMQLMDNRAKAKTIDATSESGKDVTLTIGGSEESGE